VKARAFIESLTMMGGGGSAGVLGGMAAYGAMRAGGWAAGKVGHFGRQVIRSPYNAGRYVRDRAKGLDWLSRGGPAKKGIPNPKHVDSFRLPDLDNGPRQLPPAPTREIRGGPKALGPSGPGGGGPLVPRPPSGGPPATRPGGPRRPAPSGGNGPYQSPYRRDPRRRGAQLPKGPTAPGQDGRRQLGPGSTATRPTQAARRARDTRTGSWVSVPDNTVVEPAARPTPKPSRPSAGEKPPVSTARQVSDQPKGGRRRVGRSSPARRRVMPLDDGPPTQQS
jgi:hypothetical protein